MDRLQLNHDHDPMISPMSTSSKDDTNINLNSLSCRYKFQKEEIKEAQLIITQEIENIRLSSRSRSSNYSDFSILFPGQDKFNMERLDVYNYDNICTPTLILQPKTKHDVSCCIRGYMLGMKRCISSKLKIPRLCIKGGGNSINAMKDGAVVLDLSNMRNVNVQMNHLCVYVEGGALVQDLDYTLGKYGLMSVSGTYPTLGVIGCLLAGGIGYASRKYGLSCDNLLSAEVVLADGRIVHCTSKQNTDIFYSLKGGGGGFGVVVSVTLRCYPCKNAALLTFGLYAPVTTVKKKILRRWANWVCQEETSMSMGGFNDDNSYSRPTIPECYQRELPKEVFTQLFLPTNSSIISFLSSSIDTAKLSQIENQNHTTDFFENTYSSKTTKQRMIHNCSYIPGFELFSNSNTNNKKKKKQHQQQHKFGAWLQTKLQLRFVRYCELQSLTQGYYIPGNVFLAYKYAESLSEEVMDILVQATNSSKWNPKNESRVIITSAGGTINQKSKTSSPIQRPIQYLITIEGRWNDSPSTNNLNKKKEFVIKWVHLLANQLSHCLGIQSTSHPEATREVVSKSGRSDPPIGWYNFTKENGERLKEIRKKRDGKGVFSLSCSRISWRKERLAMNDDDHDASNTVDGSDSSSKESSVRKDTVTTNTRNTQCNEQSIDDSKSI